MRLKYLDASCWFSSSQEIYCYFPAGLKCFRCETSLHWNSCCSLKHLSVRIEGFQSLQHVWAICQTVNVPLLPSLSQHSLWITLLPPTVSHTGHRDFSVFAVCWWYTDYKTQPVASCLKNKQRNKEKADRDKGKRDVSDSIQPEPWVSPLFVWMQVCVQSSRLCCLCICMIQKHAWTQPACVCNTINSQCVLGLISL